MPLALGFSLSMASIWCHEKKTFNHAELPIEKNDMSYLNLAEILYESMDLPASLHVCNQLIEQKEASHCYDQNYVEALYRASHIYSFVNIDITLQLTEKIKIHDKRLPKWQIEDGYLITDKLNTEMVNENDKLFLKKYLLNQVYANLRKISNLLMNKLKLK